MWIGAPTACTNPTGWSNERLFVDYLKHFIACERPGMEDPVLLIP